VKRLSGKGAWFLKEGEKKRAVLKARFEGMGRGEARKAMERRQKRIAQKEKRARPWAKGDSGRQTEALVLRKRKGTELAGEERKRRRVG
jgi:ribosomal RNA-processing protein 36